MNISLFNINTTEQYLTAAAIVQHIFMEPAEYRRKPTVPTIQKDGDIYTYAINGDEITVTRKTLSEHLSERNGS